MPKRAKGLPVVPPLGSRSPGAASSSSPFPVCRRFPDWETALAAQAVAIWIEIGCSINGRMSMLAVSSSQRAGAVSQAGKRSGSFACRLSDVLGRMPAALKRACVQVSRLHARGVSQAGKFHVPAARDLQQCTAPRKADTRNCDGAGSGLGYSSTLSLQKRSHSNAFPKTAHRACVA